MPFYIKFRFKIVFYIVFEKEGALLKKPPELSKKEKTFAPNIRLQAYTYFALYFQLLEEKLSNFQKNNFAGNKSDFSGKNGKQKRRLLHVFYYSLNFSKNYFSFAIKGSLPSPRVVSVVGIK